MSAGEPETKNPTAGTIATDAEIKATAVRVETRPIELGGCV
jgi:hypothetical protein